MENIPQSDRHVSRDGIDTKTMALMMVAYQMVAVMKVDISDFGQIRHNPTVHHKCSIPTTRSRQHHQAVAGRMDFYQKNL
jgi:hypothetical protein